MNKAFLEALKAAYNEVVNSTDKASTSNIRMRSAKKISAAFDLIEYQIKGSENLPYESGSIFIYNHLFNAPFFTVDSNFQLTLDSHFISSKILYSYYNDPGERVVRHALSNEKNHKIYYDKLNYVKVYSKAFMPPNTTKEEIKIAHDEFRVKTTENLRQQKGLVFSPEGNSYSTEASPGPFKLGVFKLAASIKDQPNIVPLVMTGFDKLPSEAIYKCEIMPAFKMSDYGIYSAEDPKIKNVVDGINSQYKVWVNNLDKEEINFKSEIENLKNKIHHKKNTKDLVVFYGSSSIRLWKNLETDFPKLNVLNLGFGGAYIESLKQYFETLFTFDAPRAIVLYLGGNDLNLGYSAEKIVEMIAEFIAIISQKFPQTLLFNISIKPSLERIDKLEKIQKINQLMYDLSQKEPLLEQVNFYNSIFKNGRIEKKFFLQDGLHLNTSGYNVLKTVLEVSFLEASI
jgi:lysophospholipase L1-like esterase